MYRLVRMYESGDSSYEVVLVAANVLIGTFIGGVFKPTPEYLARGGIPVSLMRFLCSKYQP